MVDDNTTLSQEYTATAAQGTQGAREEILKAARNAQYNPRFKDPHGLNTVRDLLEKAGVSINNEDLKSAKDFRELFEERRAYYGAEYTGKLPPAGTIVLTKDGDVGVLMEDADKFAPLSITVNGGHGPVNLKWEDVKGFGDTSALSLKELSPKDRARQQAQDNLDSAQNHIVGRKIVEIQKSLEYSTVYEDDGSKNIRNVFNSVGLRFGEDESVHIKDIEEFFETRGAFHDVEDGYWPNNGDIIELKTLLGGKEAGVITAIDKHSKLVTYTGGDGEEHQISMHSKEIEAYGDTSKLAGLMKLDNDASPNPNTLIPAGPKQ